MTRCISDTLDPKDLLPKVEFPKNPFEGTPARSPASRRRNSVFLLNTDAIKTALDKMYDKPKDPNVEIQRS